MKVLMGLLFFLLLSGTAVSGTAGTSQSPLIKSASEYDYPPLATVNSNGEADGFSVVLLKAALNAVGRQVDIRVDHWNTIKRDLSLGRIDVLPLVGITPERKTEFDFSNSYLVLDGAIFVRKGTSVNSTEELAGKAVITMTGDTAHEYLVRHNITDRIIEVDSYDDAFHQLAAGKHDAIICLQLVGNQLIQKSKINNIVSTGSPLTDYHQEFAFAVKKGDHYTQQLLNDGLRAVKIDGTYNKLYGEWIAPLLPAPKQNFIIQWLIDNSWTIAILILFVISIFILMHHIIRVRTRHLEKAIHRYRRLFQLSNDAIIIHDDTGRIFDANPQALRYLEHDIESLKSIKILDIHPESEHSSLLDAFNRIKEHGSIIGETMMLTSSGKLFHAEVSSSLIDSKLKLIQGIFRDITERKELETKLRESEQQFRSIIEGASDGVLIADQQTRRFIYSNPAISRILGYSKEDLSNMGVDDIHPPDQLEKNIATFERQARGESVDEDQPCLRKDGAVIYCHITVSIISIDGRPYSVGFFRDMSDFRSMSQQISQNDKMQAIGQLAGGIAHDFNNYLTGIIGYAERIRRKSDDPVHQSTAEQIKTVAKSLAELNSKLLTFARKAHFISKPFNTHQLIEDLLSLLEHTLEKKINLQCHLEASNPVIEGDKTQLENALLNLAINARDAMPDGGTITISTKTTGLKEKRTVTDTEKLEAGMYLCIRVSDTGDGIPEEVLPHIFEPFFTTKPIGKGNGMGLSSVYGIIKKHHGMISVESQQGEGTTFEILLPLYNSKTV